MQSIFKILMQGPLEEYFTQIPTRSFHKDPVRDHARDLLEDPYKSFSQGPVQIVLRPLTAFHKDLQKIFSQGLAQRSSTART